MATLKNKSALWIIPLLILIGINIPATMTLYSGQQPGVFKLPGGYIQAGWVILSGLFLLGTWFCLRNLFLPGKHAEVQSRLSWWQQTVIVMAGFAALAFIFIHVTPLRVLLSSWLAPLIILGWVLTVRVAATFSWKPLLQDISTSDIALAVLAWILIKALQDFKVAMPLDDTWRNYYYLALLFQTALLAVIRQGITHIDRTLQGIPIRENNAVWLSAGIGLSILLPILIYWLDKLFITSGVVMRLELLLLAGALITTGLGGWVKKWGAVPVFLLALAWTGFLLMAGSYLSRVTVYPYSLTWSEGNRFYDYSLIFGRHLYQADSSIQPNYFSPGRYGLWGLPFLIDGLPISVHRLWNALLYLVPGMILGWQLGRKLQNPIFRWIAVFVTAIFFNMGPVYPTLTISLIVLTVSDWMSSRWRYLLILAASLFAGLSRFTWVLAIAAWAGMADLLIHYPLRKGPWLKRLLPTALCILAGLIPGAWVSWGEVFATQGDMISSQPLLWYRLMPNSTYSFGILPGTLIATGAVLAITIWLASSKKFTLDLWQKAAAMVTIFGLLIAGTVASTKIGGGSNLHNLDMYFAILLLIFFFLMYKAESEGRLQLNPVQKLLIFLAVTIPIFSTTWSGGPLILPKDDLINLTMKTIQTEVNQRKQSGDILFMDQRQLLTFGNIQNVKLIPEYEKKYMMDQAMADNERYFQPFIADLKDHRFALIISGPLNLKEQTDIHDFNEENNAWVRHVSAPVLEYYQSIYVDKKNNIELFIPKE